MNVYLDYWADQVRTSRAMRSMPGGGWGEYDFDPPPPENYSAEHVEFALKLVAHWEGGPHPDDPAAVPVELKLESDESDESA